MKSTHVIPIVHALEKQAGPLDGKLDTNGLYVFNSEKGAWELHQWDNLSNATIEVLKKQLKARDGVGIQKIETTEGPVYGLTILDPEYNSMLAFTETGRYTHTRVERR
ncbi:hypothetical protein A2363_02925 [Candidatus Gottesmanbacteria bacterium RIFOXYB1_FULL_47_11]|uniref:Uncharacterized protein n=1 Tax=Candidatus Gottesmanbacteria bacterium RIFOXYB1_FULL_47_11 TaxID=1798401 RepID=A0A1F6BCU0_9BACT|nr:MAG: hypothetical protein A2363_02925 [Candidatus Gottesmanbacteria bacterium RIFOXYB1_FULL_47_11]